MKIDTRKFKKKERRMDGELKATKNLSLDPIVISWLIQKAATESISQGRTVSVSEVANEILKDTIQGEDPEHVRKLLKKIEGKK